MSLLSRKIADAVDAAEGPGAATAAEGPHRLTLHLTAASPVGVAFDALEFADSGRVDRPADDLRAWGDRLAARLTYLMEPLVVIEVDAEAGEAALRSRSPSARGAARSYYEVRLRREGTLRLRRVAFDDADRLRRDVPCQLTREALERLADDLVAVA